MSSYNKQTIFTAVINNLESQLAVSLEAANNARSQATHTECIAQSRYDTLGLEQAYLAEGQSVRAANLQLEISLIKDLQGKYIINKHHSDEILLTSVVLLKKHTDGCQQHLCVFILPISGGIAVQIEQTTIQVLSVKSPLGKALLGKESQEQVFINQTHYEILNVS
jgi:transcription elongation GreA/GreB family factor